ncbi:syntaxin-5 [Onthophagus taurus]|uniref:syntaxin-5 n=1 Tax=Onthophagus taurus TaxID=166361 RepID=UPI000C208E25|nr:syntaxin-5 [Onthophagus taurus]
MQARRRRAGSESEPFIVVESNSWLPKDTSNRDVSQRYYVEEFIDDFIEPEVVMTARDRTSEFINTIQSLQGRNIARAVSVKDARKSRIIQSHTEFMLIAKNIGRNISSSYTKLEKLTLLAKKRSLFDDRTSEIQELTYIIKGDLNSLNQQIAQLQEVSKKQRSTTNGKHLQSHSSSVVLALQSKLATMSTDFKQILEVRTENLRHQKNRRDQFSQSGVSSGLPPSFSAQNPNSALMQDQESTMINLESSALIPKNHMQAALIRDETDNYLQNRAETMQNIESTIVELGGIFQQLAHMVKEQEEMVERIDTNVQDAELNIEAAHAQILKYFQSVTSNRWLMIKIFGVLIFFFIFFIVFMA